MTGTTDRIVAFVDAVAPLTATSSERLQQIIASVLALPDLHDVPPGVSALNNDGSPLEICITLRGSQSHVRVVADPAHDALLPDDRHARTERVLEDVFERNANPLRAAASRLLHMSVMPDRRAYRDGFAWIAASLDGTGAALYVDTRPHGSNAWTAARAWMRELLPDPAAAMQDIDALASFAELSSISLEGATLADARVKLYFRMREPRSLAAWGIGAFRDPRYLGVLSILVGDRNPPLDGLVASAGYALSTGARADSKIDVCGHCVDRGSEEWSETIASCCRAAAIEAAHAALPDDMSAVSVAFVGLGIGRSGDARLNVYLRPRDDDAARVERAIGRAITSLLQLQENDGSWWDYELPVGRADAWVTAYVGYALALAGRRWRDARNAAMRAAEWLQSQRTAPAGWGFNAVSGPDADSTAFAIALFTELGLPVEDRDREFLASHLQKNGGVSTYRTSDAWGLAHPDVTPLAFLGLPSETQNETRERTLAWLRGQKLADGTWPAYWWRTGAYTAFAIAGLLGASSIETLHVAASDDAFEIACALGALAATGDARAHGMARTLVAQQRADGAWSGGRNLRVTSPDCAEPWVQTAGDYYDDFRNTITTATAIRALLLVNDRASR